MNNSNYMCRNPVFLSDCFGAFCFPLNTAQVIAGHLWFGVHRVVKNVPVYVTCLRRPLDTAISGRIYLHEKEMKVSTPQEDYSFHLI